MIAYADWLSKYNISMKTDGAKANAIESIFGAEASDDVKRLKKDIEDAMYEARMTGKEADFDFQNAFNSEKLQEFKQRLYDMGLTVTDVKYYFLDLDKAEKEASNAYSTYDTVKQINSLSGGIKGLQDGFKEFNDQGYMSIETLVGLEETFGGLGDKWESFVNTVATGSATLEQAKEVVNDLAEAYLMEKMSAGVMSAEEELQTMMLLTQLGIKNAKEYLDAMKSVSAISSIAKESTDSMNLSETDRDKYLSKDEAQEYSELSDIYGPLSEDQMARLQELETKALTVKYDVVLSAEEERLLIEKAITLEKKKQEAAEMKAAKTAYDNAMQQKDAAEEANRNIDDEINALSTTDQSGLENKYGVTSTPYNEHGYSGTHYNYNGRSYSTLDEVRQAIATDLEANKSEVPEIPTTIVTEADVSNADKEVDRLTTEYQKYLDEHGLTVDVTVSDYSGDLDKIQSAYSSLKDIITEYNAQGYLSLDNLQAFLSLDAKYMALLQMENGQLTLNQKAMEAMIETKLAEAEAEAINTAMTQLNALANRKQAIEVSNSGIAANEAQLHLRTYSNLLGDVSTNAIISAGSVTAFNNALKDAENNPLVDSSEIETVVSTLDSSLGFIDSTRKNLQNAFNQIVDPDTDTDDAVDEAWKKLLAKYDNQLSLLSNERDLIQAEIDKAEAQGGKASAKYYEDLKRNSAEEKTLLEAKKKALEEYLEANANSIDQDTWTEYNNEINETAVAIKECTTNLLEYYDALEELDSHYFGQAIDEVSRLGEEIEFVQGLLEDEDVADENGNWTSAGVTQLGLYVNEMERAAASAESYKKQLSDVSDSWNEYQQLLEDAQDVNEDGVINVEDVATDKLDELYDSYGYVITSEEEYKEKTDELTDSVYSEIDAYNSAKDGIVELNEARIDAIRTGIEKEIEAYEDLIDAKKETLDAERDLYDFRKNVKNQTKEISELERRIASLSGSSAASDIALRRKLEAQLLEAKEGLNDTYYDHSRDAQSQALDEESEAYTLSKERYIEQLEEQLKDTETLIQNSMMDVLLNADTVYNELNILADTYGVTLSEELTQPWKDASEQAILWKAKLDEQLTASELALITHENGPITAFSNGVAEKLKGPWDSAKNAVKTYSDYLTGTELGTGFSNTLTGFGAQIQGIIDKWNGVKAAADAAYAAQTRKVTVGGNENVGDGGEPPPPNPEEPPKKEIVSETAYLKTSLGVFNATGKGHSIDEARLNAKNSVIQRAYNAHRAKKYTDEQLDKLNNTWELFVTYTKPTTTDYDVPKVHSTSNKLQNRMYAKGTTGTTHDEWAITDESWIGEEITLAAGKSGRLRGMMKGSAVLPSDISENLMEWGKLSPNEMHSGNVVNNYVNAPTNDVDVANSLTINGHSSSTQDVHDSIRDTYELIEDTVSNINAISQYYKPSVDEALTTPWVDATEKTDEFNAAANANYDDIVNHVDEHKESLEIALNTPYANVIDDINDFSQHAKKASADDVITHANEQSSTLTTALSTGFNDAKNATDAFKASGTSAVNAVKDSFTNAKTGLIKALNDTTSAAQRTKQAIDSVPAYSGGGGGSGVSVQDGQHYISSLGKNVTLSSNVTKWSGVAAQALQKTGQYSYDNLLLLLHQMQTESSGNQNAINNWDINAKNGTPSKGLLQVIDPTFQAYAMSGYDKDIYDPLSNIIASIRYTTSRYGSLAKGWKGSGYAKGTTGVSEDQLSIVDEFGPELILHADPTTGRLQYLTKGSGVVPSELTEELMELGRIGVDGLMGANKFAPNINMISNAVNKPEIVIDVENFLKVDRVDKDTLPQLEAMMDKKIDTFARQLNYSIKRFSR